MNEFTIIAFDRNKNEIPLPAGLIAVPLWYDEQAIGGSDRSEIEIYGAPLLLYQLFNWLGYELHILNRHLSCVWRGYAEEILVNSEGPLRSGLSLKNLYNRVAVQYTIAKDGLTETYMTPWAQNTESVTTFGPKEFIAQLDNASTTAAIAHRDALLTALSNAAPLYGHTVDNPALTALLNLLPAASEDQAQAYRDALLTAWALPVNLHENQTHAGAAMAKLRCKGLFHKAQWTRYTNPAGYEANAKPTGSEQIMGQGFTSTGVGFAKSGRISDLNGHMSSLITNTQIRISGSAANDGLYTIKTTDKRPPQAYAAPTISFDPSDDIHDPALQLSFLNKEDFFTISGSAANNGTYRCTRSGGEHITADPKTIIAGAAGPTVTIARGNMVEVATRLASEFPGATITITTVGQKLRQTWTPSAGTWTVNQMWLRIKKVGDPVDDVKIEHCDNRGSVLDSTTVPAAAISKMMAWTAFQLTNTQSVTYGTNYKLTISRTGANDPANYYIIDVDEDLAYAGGAMELYTGAAWINRTPNATLIFRITDAQETTAQIQTIAAAVSATTTTIADVDIVNPANVTSPQYRASAQTAYKEIVNLLKLGSNNGRRMLARLTDDNVLKIWEQPAKATVDPTIMLAIDGTLRHTSGQPLEHGRLCAGQWVTLAEIPPSVGHLTGLTPVFIERAIFNCRDEVVTLVPEGTAAAWTLGVALND